MFAVLSDIHSNLEALDAVLQDVAAQGIREILSCGDIVGYGPNPAEVVDRAMDWKATVKGNHDEAVVNESFGFNPVAREAIGWTREQLKPGFLSGRAKRGRWEFLQGLPLTHREGPFEFVHGSPRDPTMEYILKTDIDEFAGVSDKLRDIFTRFDRVLFVGHTHEPGVFTEDGQYFSVAELNGTFRIPAGGKCILNAGSVGQPRDGDNRACWVSVDGDTVRWRRVAYDFRTTQAKIRAIPQLDPRVGDRLELGR